MSDVWMRFRIENDTMLELMTDGSTGTRYENEFNLPPGDYAVSRISKPTLGDTADGTRTESGTALEGEEGT